MAEQTEIYRIRRTRSIGFRMSLLVTVAIVIFGVLAIYLMSNRQGWLYRNEKIRQWEILIDSLTPNLMNLLASSDFEGIDHILDRVTAEQEELHHVYLCNEHDDIIYSIDLKQEGGRLTGEQKKTLAAGRRVDTGTGVQVQQFVREIESGTSRLGALYMGFEYLPSLEKERLTSILTLENAIDATETAAQILEGIVIKNS